MRACKLRLNSHRTRAVYITNWLSLDVKVGGTSGILAVILKFRNVFCVQSAASFSLLRISNAPPPRRIASATVRTKGIQARN